MVEVIVSFGRLLIRVILHLNLTQLLVMKMDLLLKFIALVLIVKEPFLLYKLVHGYISFQIDLRQYLRKWVHTGLKIH